MAAVLEIADRGDRDGDLVGKLKADVRVTRQQRKTSAAALRILFVTRVGILPQSTYLSSAKTPAP